MFVNLIEKNAPKANDKNVIYFGPGVHEVSNLTIGDHKTVYVAGGAIIKAVIGKDEKYTTEPSGLRNYLPTIILAGKNIKFCGRGIIDASACTTHARNIIAVCGVDISVEGLTLTNPSVCTLPISQGNRINVNNIKIIGYRAKAMVLILAAAVMLQLRTALLEQMII